MKLGRTQPAPPPERTPHPDSRVEAELQRVLSMQRTAARTEARLGAVTLAQAKLDERRRAYADDGKSVNDQLARQARELRDERRELEASLGPLHDEIAARLAALGDDALMLYGQSS